MEIQALQYEKLRQHVMEQVGPLGRMRGEEITILCPFHSERTPSMSIHVGFRLTPGAFHCFGCGASGSFNKLARQLDLVSYDYGPSSKGYQGSKDDPFLLMGKYLNAQDEFKLREPEILKGIEPLSPKFTWRGYGRKFYESFGGKFWWERNLETDFEMDWLYFPILMRKEYKGYTICALKPNKPKYKTFADTSSTFFLYDHVPDGGPVVLVEGHFDSLKLQALGIPAMAVFGTQNWGPIKKELLAAKTPSKVVIAMDGDDPGYKAAEEIFLDLRAGFNVDIFWLPNDGNKVDPGNMGEEYVEKLRSML
jgi:hypothetical protein